MVKFQFSLVVLLLVLRAAVVVKLLSVGQTALVPQCFVLLLVSAGPMHFGTKSHVGHIPASAPRFSEKLYYYALILK